MEPSLEQLADAYYSPTSPPETRAAAAAALGCGHRSTALLGEALSLVAAFAGAGDRRLAATMAAVGLLEQCVRVRASGLDDGSCRQLWDVLWRQALLPSPLSGKAGDVLTLLVQVTFPRLWEPFLATLLERLGGSNARTVAAAARLAESFLGRSTNLSSLDRSVPRQRSRELRTAIEAGFAPAFAAAALRLLERRDELRAAAAASAPPFEADDEVLRPALAALQVRRARSPPRAGEAPRCSNSPAPIRAATCLVGAPRRVPLGAARNGTALGRKSRAAARRQGRLR